MVLFINVHLNQRVEVDIYGDIHTGKVKYKGPLNGKSGDWVGIAMDRAVGLHDGMLQGRRYFSCRPYHGIFTTAERIRFIPFSRNSYSDYRPVSRQSEVDEALFTSYSSQMIEDDYPAKCVGWVSENYLDQASNTFPCAGKEMEPPNYHLRHSVSNSLSARTQLMPTSTKARFFYPDESYEYHNRYYRDWGETDLSPPWISKPSIPKTHVPHRQVETLVERGWDYDPHVRRMSILSGRDEEFVEMKYRQWDGLSE